jgi:hypothetical protein
VTDLKEAIRQRQIRRLCHFTPSRNLPHIISSGLGIVASSALASDVRAVFNPTDLERLDGHADHVCCSIEYPNAWYFHKARAKEQLFRDWAILLISPDALLIDGAKFSPRNAAAGAGRYVREGLDGFGTLYVREVIGAYNKKLIRTPTRPIAVPTDDQAEVLIPKLVPLSMILGVVVGSAEQARAEVERLRIARLARPRFFIAPHFYDRTVLSDAIREGNVPPEIPHDEPEE